MKKILLGLILLCSTSAWGDNTLAIEDFAIAAGEEKDIDVKMYNDVTFTAFQFELELPEGVSVKFDEDEEEYCVARSNRLLNAHNVVSQYQSNGAFKVMVYHNTNKNLKGNSGDVVLTLTLIASDQVSTGTFTPHINNIEMTEYNSTTQTATKYKPEAVTYNCTVNINATVTTLGYASFSWPRALDFTNSGLTAFIAKDCNGQSIQLHEVTKVPANTGLILKGIAGSENTYSLETTDEETLDDVSSNQLTGTASGAYTVEGENIYVLSNLDDGTPGFYNANEGIHVGQYKAYLAYTGDIPARTGLTFDEGDAATGIESCKQEERKGNLLFYDLQGRNVNQPQKGVYVSNGRKVIVK